MAQALYRKYRSKSLAEVVGQSHITDVLSRALQTGRISHAYLLTGPRGVGKTSVARILAHEINQLPYDDETTHLDIIEIDAASNNGVDDVRNLREKVQLAPVSAAKKVYIIDEVHMLSKPAFNALLKTLEEPPEHVVFILATTDLDKLPATIISRTQRFAFRAIKVSDAVAHLRMIAEAENIKVDEEALALIAKRGDGSFRDSISLLDQLANLADDKAGITAALVQETLGLAAETTVETILAAISQHDIATIATQLDDAQSQGIAATTIATQLTDKVIQLLSQKPAYTVLLDQLLDVSHSSQPYIKLLAVLGSAAAEAKPPKSAALATPVLEVSATIEALSQPVSKKKAKETLSVAPQPANQADFSWETFVEYCRSNFVALHSVLSKCRYDIKGDTLILYTGNAFYKKKLDDQKYSTQLYETLMQLGYGHLTIKTLSTTMPPKSSQAVSVAAIMGGGEEVNLDANAPVTT